MHGHGIEPLGEGVTQRDAFLAVRRRDTDLDQFVRGERAIGFRDQFLRDAGVADAYDGVQDVRPGFQVGPFASREGDRHRRIVAAPRQPNAAFQGHTSIDMPVLSEHARFVLERMEPDRHYDVHDVRAFVPDASVEGIREIMHELWVNRDVERIASSGWRRHRSAAGQKGTAGAKPVKLVKPEDLFDHDTFEDFFR